MTTSLASSPVLPIVMAGVAGLLVVGTLSTPDKSPPEPVANPIPVACTGNVCTITFPKVGDSAQAFGGTVQAMAFYTDGADVSVLGERIVSSLKVAAKAGGYTLKILTVDPAAGVTVKITKK